ncbi:MAG: phosphatidylserine decarboxylase [Chlorobiales bacterium]|nr:phosphatidylserine decarboxylase [Chlorobiales bacterium]
MFTLYGRSTIIKVLFLSLLLSAPALFFPFWARIAIFFITASIVLFTLYFFRDPKRKVPDETRIILAPADGKILLVQQHDHKVTGKSSTLVSIFMSPFNVHVNRIPLSGKVTHLRYCPGQFLMAFDNRSMESNEKMEIGIDNGEIQVLFNQISGFLARRIVCALTNGETVKAGEKFGMIKFGSRVDVILPPSASVLVKPGQVTLAGETILARY